MNRFTIIGALIVAAHLAAFGAESGKGGGFLPLTPEGYPLGASNTPLRVVAAPAVPPVAAGASNAASSAPAEPDSIVLDDSHKLVPGDKLSFQILEDRHIPNLDNRAPSPTAEQSKAIIVADTSELEIPYVGRVSVSGKTCKDVAAELKVLLEKDYYYRATVVLGLDQMSRVLGHVYVWGEVRNQGAIDIPPNETLTVSKAILRAGGFNEWAKRSKVKILRAPKSEGGAKEEIYVDMDAVLKAGKIEKDVPLHPDDTIVVPRSKINF